MEFTANAVLVKTERGYRPEQDYWPDSYFSNTRGTLSLATKDEKKNIGVRRFILPGDERFFDGHH